MNKKMDINRNILEANFGVRRVFSTSRIFIAPVQRGGSSHLRRPPAGAFFIAGPLGGLGPHSPDGQVRFLHPLIAETKNFDTPNEAKGFFS